MSLLCFNQAVEELQSGSPSLGFRLLRELADEGYETAQLHVGCGYLLGHIGSYNVKKDMKKAITYLYKCAKQGNQDALHNLKELRKNVSLDDYVTQARTEIPTERIL